ncbi:hypothetical protein CROQUDRAFT_652395 [Cronartium quercuum f. sp. fusiforme G11]|uniref:Uncharacterized protein n=1 Tax=Cronartium quercuum f. sp. fusiforme G11 TaxID=708437 RepID=A0A9P6NR32_9BASI|nr:hypothetical protein CROQUDRAFT_652395 [Cronartium quercuum f. sp. fusiforme G11]
MLSSGTLNLKFMKRNLGTATKPNTSEKTENSDNTETPISRPAVDRKGKQRQTETKVVYEDSLMGFPVIYGFGGFTGEVSTSAFAGRRSFGNFNSAVEQLGKAPSRPEPSAPTQQSSHSSRSHAIKPSSSKKAERNPVRPTQDKSSRSKSKPTVCKNSKDSPSRPSQDIPATASFQRPFQNAQIKPNPKKRATPTDSESQGSKDGDTNSQRNKKPKPQTTNLKTAGSKSKRGGRSSSSSDDSETVNHEIERMFLECRDSNPDR